MDKSNYPPPQYTQGQQPTSYYNPGMQQQQQQPSVVVVTQPRSYTSFTCAIVLSCFVFWCCGWLFGLIAFILAMVGQSSAASGDETSARQMLKASYGVSIAGIVVAIIIIIIIVIVVVTAANHCPNVAFSNCPWGYYMDGVCKKC